MIRTRIAGNAPTGLGMAGLALLLTASTSGCAGGGQTAEKTGLQVERSTEGNATVIRNLAGSHWPAPATLEEDLSIGVVDGDDAYMFGRVRSLWATDEQIYVVDNQAPALRVFDQQGRHLRDLGQQGQGPGEYERPGAVVTLPDGTVVVEDSRDNRLTFYSRDGAVLRTWTPEERFISDLYVLNDGSLLVRRADPPSEEQPSRGMLNLEYGLAEVLPSGELGEPRYPPDFAYEAPAIIVETASSVMAFSGSFLFAPFVRWDVAPSGSIVAGLSNQYRFEIHSLDGEVTVVERYWDPVPVPPNHAKYLIARIEAQSRQMVPDWTYDGDAPATTKPAYSNLVVDRDNRIWVERAGASEAISDCVENPRLDLAGALERPCWRQHTIIDAFTPDGEYLGEVQRPAGLTFKAVFIKGDHYYAAVEDEDGLVMVKRFRIVVPAANAR